MIYLANAFSLQMLEGDATVTVSTASVEAVVTALTEGAFTAAIGHADTAAVVSGILGLNVPQNRVNVSLKPGDVLFVAQLTGGRLPEGTTSLPEGFQLVWKRVEIV